MCVASVAITTSERGNCKELNCAASETSPKLIPSLRRKLERRLNELKNGKHVTLNDTTQLAGFCMSNDTNSGLVQKGQTPMDCNRFSLTKNGPTALSQDICQMARMLTCALYPNIVLKRKSAI